MNRVGKHVTLVAIALAFSCAQTSAREIRPAIALHAVMKIESATVAQPAPIGRPQMVRVTEQQCRGTALEQNMPGGLGCGGGVPAQSVEVRLLTHPCPIRVTRAANGMFVLTRFARGGSVNLSTPTRRARGLCEIEFRDRASHAFATVFL